jgi:hypothetical protein
MQISLAVHAVRSGVLVSMILAQAAHSAESPGRLRSWSEYRTIMWIGESGREHPEQFGLFLSRLREMGINTAMVYDDGNPQPLVDNGFPYYVENLVNRGLCLKFSSHVSDWDKFVTDWARNGRKEAGLIRDYCLDDPQWLNWAKTATQNIVKKNRVHQPLAYNLRDELSTTLSANPFDYDFNPSALEQFRVWLKTQYADVAALNAEWQTRFASWEQVKPFTTDEIKNRMATGEALPRGRPDWQQVQQTRFAPALAQRNPTAWNFAPWADFRTYMDLSLARTLDQLRQAAHELDPATPVGIEGTQMPHAFGGYDLWRLSRVLDWVEPYDIGGAREIFGSFMADKPVLTTVFESETRPAKRRLWHLLLEGDRGCLVWWSEDCLDWKSPELPLTAKARALAPVLREMTGPLARLFLRAERSADPILIHYSQPSIQVDWLLESTVDGSTWLRRFSSFESEHNQMAKTRSAWLKGLQDLGFTPRFVSSAEIEEGKLRRLGDVVLVLPESWALSQRERAEIGWLADPKANGVAAGEVLVEGEAGAFDEHGRFRGTVTGDGFPRSALTNSGCLALNSKTGTSRTSAHSRDYLAERLKTGTNSAWLSWLEDALGPRRPAVLVKPNAQVRVHRFKVKAGRLLAFERNIQYQMSEELKQAGGNQALETPVEVEATLAKPAEVYDLRSGAYLGHTDRLRFILDPWEPSLFALLPQKVPAQSLMSVLEEK